MNAPAPTSAQSTTARPSTPSVRTISTSRRAAIVTAIITAASLPLLGLAPTKPPAPAATAASAPARFLAVDVIIETGDTPLAAYQVQLTPLFPGATLVGVEGAPAAPGQAEGHASNINAGNTRDTTNGGSNIVTNNASNLNNAGNLNNSSNLSNTIDAASNTNLAANNAQLIDQAAPDRPFANPPVYDPAALAGGRVILAQLSTSDAASLPRGSVTVCRTHWRLPGIPTLAPGSDQPAPTIPALEQSLRAEMMVAGSDAATRFKPAVRLALSAVTATPPAPTPPTNLPADPQSGKPGGNDKNNDANKNNNDKNSK